jgi:Family of unknown function (DUF6183)
MPADDELLVETAQIQQLCSDVDRLVLDGDWVGVLAARDDARAALERGHQLWPVAAYADYRIALDGPAALASSVVDATSSRYTLGPFPEVMATTHQWHDLRDHLPATPGASTLAHEFVAAGVALDEDRVALSLPPIFELPLALQPWEPAYRRAIYHLDRVEHDAPVMPSCRQIATKAAAGNVISDPIVTDALTALVRSWSTESNGRVEARAVEGDAVSAIASLGVSRPYMAEIDLAQAVSLMGWAASGGGAHGRRRGLASARSDVWWALTALTGLAEQGDGEPIHPDELGEVLDDLRWTLWSAGEPDTGWALRLAIEVPDEGLAWVIGAIDAA